jgi:transposase
LTRPGADGGTLTFSRGYEIAVIRSLLSTASKEGWDIPQTLIANPDSLIANLRVG